ncbi:MAG TPA: N-6 DNA methylase, partial [Oleiagrimonas sp.]|nr:N-6 DNA methylase [Oleiagrimonas sp.]
RDQILFINADREYGEGKAQNKLRPEDIEKIDFVFTHKRELPKYSRLVSKAEIVDQHDCNLNIRRYVDNTPEPEPEDVQAHLIGGIPDDEIAALAGPFAQFGITADSLFAPERAGYQGFVSSIDAKPAIKRAIEADAALAQTIRRHQAVLEGWWAEARDEFAQLEDARNGGKQSPEVRHDLITSLKHQLVPLGVLDEFKSAGVFVNWWQQIRYDLKTIIATGWHHSLIPDAYLIAEFFQPEADAIEALEATIAEQQAALDEAVETAIEVAAWEPDEDEKASAAVLKKALKALIDDLKNAMGDSAIKERDNLKEQDAAIKTIEKRIKTAKAAHKAKQNELEQKLELKRLGGDGFKAEARALIEQNTQRREQLDQTNKADKRKINALNKDQTALQARLENTDALLTAIGGQLTDAQARELILKKLYDIVHAELDRYLNAEKRALIAAVENLWEKYAVSSRRLELARGETLKSLDGMLAGLGYVS